VRIEASAPIFHRYRTCTFVTGFDFGKIDEESAMRVIFLAVNTVRIVFIAVYSSADVRLSYFKDYPDARQKNFCRRSCESYVKIWWINKRDLDVHGYVRCAGYCLYLKP